jgi:hypothetical protein
MFVDEQRTHDERRTTNVGGSGLPSFFAKKVSMACFAIGAAL